MRDRRASPRCLAGQGVLRWLTTTLAGGFLSLASYVDVVERVFVQMDDFMMFHEKIELVYIT